MHLRTFMKGLDDQPFVEARIEQLSNKLTKYFRGEFSLNWNLSRGKGEHTVEIHVSGPGHTFTVSSKDYNLNNSMDEALRKVEKRLKVKKDKWRNRISRKNNKVPRRLQLVEDSQREENTQINIELAHFEEDLKKAA